VLKIFRARVKYVYVISYKKILFSPLQVIRWLMMSWLTG
jgi:hypothetical protein